MYDFEVSQLRSLIRLSLTAPFHGSISQLSHDSQSFLSKLRLTALSHGSLSRLPLTALSRLSFRAFSQGSVSQLSPTVPFHVFLWRLSLTVLSHDTLSCLPLRTPSRSCLSQHPLRVLSWLPFTAPSHVIHRSLFAPILSGWHFEGVNISVNGTYWFIVFFFCLRHGKPSVRHRGCRRKLIKNIYSWNIAWTIERNKLKKQVISLYIHNLFHR